MDKIHYAFGRDYLKSWTIKDALREVFQNYIDHGQYHSEVKDTPNNEIIYVTLSNTYNPSSLEFLRLGKTSKDDGQSIGHHGEGLKAAFLIFAREDLYFAVNTGRNRLIGAFSESKDIGETFHISYTNTDITINGFVTSFHCDRQTYEEFVKEIVTSNDVLHDEGHYGQLLNNNKKVGNIYSGGLFVCHIPDLNYAYNIKPEHLRLDRDRRAPAEWDVDYSTSKILEDYKSSQKGYLQPYTDYSSRDTKYLSRVTERDLAKIKSVTINNKVQYYDTVHEKVINNPNIIQTLSQNPKFKKDITLNKREKFNRAKKANRRKSLLTVIKAFKTKYCTSEDMIVDIDVIIDKINTSK